MNLDPPTRITIGAAAIFVSISEIIFIEDLAFQVMALGYGTRKVIYLFEAS